MRSTIVIVTLLVIGTDVPLAQPPQSAGPRHVSITVACRATAAPLLPLQGRQTFSLPDVLVAKVEGRPQQVTFCSGAQPSEEDTSAVQLVLAAPTGGAVKGSFPVAGAVRGRRPAARRLPWGGGNFALFVTVTGIVQ